MFYCPGDQNNLSSLGLSAPRKKPDAERKNKPNKKNSPVSALLHFERRLHDASTFTPFEHFGPVGEANSLLHNPIKNAIEP